MHPALAVERRTSNFAIKLRFLAFAAAVRAAAYAKGIAWPEVQAGLVVP